MMDATILSTTDVALSVRGVGFDYSGKVALEDVTFEVRQSPVPNELIVILPNFDVSNVNRGTLILAFQQMVYTLTELPDVYSVQFSVNNRLYPVPLKSGDKPVGMGVRRVPDYDPESIFTTTTTTLPPPTTVPATTAAIW